MHKLNPPPDQAPKLQAGLTRLPERFVARLCPLCYGAGQYPQTYTAGCGGGYFTAMGTCDYCHGWGLLVNREPAPSSVYNQVMEAVTEEDKERIRQIKVNYNAVS